jgi:acyl-CoA reductase-like NAD-dependent aldehyde dehydrogenase
MNAELYIGSNLIKKDENSRENIYSPFNNEIVSTYPVCSVEEAEECLKVAEKSAKITKKTTISQRINWLLDVAKRLKEKREEVAKTITDEVGKPISFARVEVDRCVETITLSADTMRTIHGETINTDATNSGRKTVVSYFNRVPVGVVVAITPFNFPLNLVAHKIAPALVSGNSVVLKPTPEAPLTAFKLAELFIISEYAIPDALSIIYGDAEVGGALVASDIPRVISFTGSVPVGNIITKSAGIKKVALELGGNAGTYIDESADLEYSASRCVVGAFTNSGQVCISLQRIYVNRKVYDKFAELIEIEARKLKVGSPYDAETFMGPLINTESVERAKNWLNSAVNEGAKPVTEIRADGRILYPVIMRDVTDDMAIICEEVFAPIVSLVAVDDIEEAISKINNSPYGLQFSIFTNNLQNSLKFIEESESGGVVVNDIPTLRFDIQPYGGVKLSGVGREGPRFAIEEFTEIKSVTIIN